ncbi:protein of unknown function [Candidatus Nitrosocosmicus franklandus]|uniref:Uncharacterized protein n=1 Tax=Candidatus Nitrosocosmicus franklandianus TaxID=1798806 RepID=A0A484IGA6_9ARCH|nr:protein of unknown function [Candidatus Nitrosocosmicus franklandus]
MDSRLWKVMSLVFNLLLLLLLRMNDLNRIVTRFLYHHGYCG